MVSKAAKVRLGVFVIAGLAILTLFVALVVGNRLVKKNDTYYIRFRNFSVYGLQTGSAVHYNGIPVGRVEKIAIDPRDVSNVILTISVEHGTPVKADNEAVLFYVGITGTKAVEIRGGSNTSPLLKPKGFIRAGSSGLDEITGRAASIVDKVDEIADNLRQLTAEENRRNIAEILSQTSALVSDTRTQLSSTLSSLNTIAASTANIASEVGSNFSSVTASLTANLDSLTVATQTSLEHLTGELSQKLDRVTTNLDGGITDIRAQADALLTETRTQVASIGSHSDTLILDSTKQIAEMSLKLNSTLDRVNQLLASSEFDELIANVNDLTAQLNQADIKGIVGNLSVTINKAGNLITHVDRILIRNRVNLNETLESLREASDNLNEFSRQISDQPSLILRSN